MSDLAGKTALVTGATSGIGMDLASALAGACGAVRQVVVAAAMPPPANVHVRRRRMVGVGVPGGAVALTTCGVLLCAVQGFL